MTSRCIPAWFMNAFVSTSNHYGSLVHRETWNVKCLHPERNTRCEVCHPGDCSMDMHEEVARAL